MECSGAEQLAAFQFDFAMFGMYRIDTYFDGVVNGLFLFLLFSVVALRLTRGLFVDYCSRAFSVPSRVVLSWQRGNSHPLHGKKPTNTVLVPYSHQPLSALVGPCPPRFAPTSPLRGSIVGPRKRVVCTNLYAVQQVAVCRTAQGKGRGCRTQYSGYPTAIGSCSENEWKQL